MNKIDIDKFICSMIEHQMDGSIYKNQLLDSLKQQGIIYKDGSLIKIGSKKCEGKLKEMLDEKVLANSCESSKDSQRIAREEVIEKACEWLNNFYSKDRHCFLVKEDIKAFKQAMEKGE